MNSLGMAKSTTRFDEHNQAVERSFFGTNEVTVVISFGYARWTARFDERGNEIEKAWFDLAGNPAINNDPKFGAAKITSRFDPRGNLTEKAYYGTNNLPIEVGGFARVASVYDLAANKLLQTTYYNAGGSVIPEPAKP
jgi:hypothetical protein